MHQNKRIPDSIKNLLNHHTFNVLRFTHYLHEGNKWTFLNADYGSGVEIKFEIGGELINLMHPTKEIFAAALSRAEVI